MPTLEPIDVALLLERPPSSPADARSAVEKKTPTLKFADAAAAVMGSPIEARSLAERAKRLRAKNYLLSEQRRQAELDRELDETAAAIVELDLGKQSAKHGNNNLDAVY